MSKEEAIKVLLKVARDFLLINSDNGVLDEDESVAINTAIAALDS